MPNGEWREIELADLFLPQVEFQRELTAAIISDLVQRRVGWYDEQNGIQLMRPKPEDKSEHLLRVWNIMGDGLEFTFAPDVVGYYSAGVQAVHITWENLPPRRAEFLSGAP